MNLLFIISQFVFFSYGHAQNICIETIAPYTSTILYVKSNTKGVLLPRTSNTSRNAIINPPKELLLYDTTTFGFWFHNGTAWTQIVSADNLWSLAGNAEADSLTFILNILKHDTE